MLKHRLRIQPDLPHQRLISARHLKLIPRFFHGH
jgi:hypothetical protein